MTMNKVISSQHSVLFFITFDKMTIRMYIVVTKIMRLLFQDSFKFRSRVMEQDPFIACMIKFWLVLILEKFCTGFKNDTA